MFKRQWPMALVLFLLMPALVAALYFYAQTPSGAERINRLMGWMEKNGLNSSIGRQYMSKKVFKAQDYEVIPDLRPSQEGMWLVGPRAQNQGGVEVPTNVDTDQLHHALAKAQAGNTIRLMSGTYKLPLWTIDKTLTIEPLQGAKATLELAETVTVTSGSGPQSNLPVLVSIQQVHISATKPYYLGAAIALNNGALKLKDVTFKGENQEMLLALKGNSSADLFDVRMNPGDRASAIFLTGASTLQADRLSIIGAKEGITTDPLQFQGKIQLAETSIKNARGNAISLYGGELSGQKITMTNGKGGLLLRRGAKGQIRLGQWLQQELHAVDVSGDSSLRLMDSQVEKAGKSALLIQDNKSSVQLIQSQVFDIPVGIDMIGRSQLELVASTIEAQELAIKIAADGQFSCTQGTIKGGHSGLESHNAQITLDECLFQDLKLGMKLGGSSRLQQKKVQYRNVKTPIQKEDGVEISTLP